MYICIQVDRKTDFIAGGMILILYLRLYTKSCKYFGVPTMRTASGLARVCIRSMCLCAHKKDDIVITECQKFSIFCLPLNPVPSLLLLLDILRGLFLWLVCMTV